MMAMNHQLDDLEGAFLEAVEPGFNSRPTAQSIHTKKKSTPRRRSRIASWWSNAKDTFVSKLICCAPSKALLDDEEIADLLASMDEPIKCTHVCKEEEVEEESPLADISFVLHQKCTDIVPVAVEYASDASTEVDESSDEERDYKTTRTTDVLTRVSTAVLAVATMQSLVHETKQRAVVAAIQQRWRQKKARAAVATPVPTPTVVISEPEPEIEAEIPMAEQVFAPSKRHRSRRSRKHRSQNKKTKTVSVEPVIPLDTEAVAESEAEAETPSVIASKKRPRGAVSELPTSSPRPQQVHEEEEGEEEGEGEDDELVSFFGEETIDEDFHVHDYHSMARSESIAPPVTACRPIPIKSRALQQAQAAVLMQQPIKQDILAFELVELSEVNSRMGEIRSKMALVRQRLELLRSRSSSSENEGAYDLQDEFDWL